MSSVETANVMRYKRNIFVPLIFILIFVILFNKYPIFSFEKSQSEDNDIYVAKRNKTRNKETITGWMQRMENKYSKINERIKRICKKFNNPIREAINETLLLVDTRHKLAGCTHAKVGSSTWWHHFISLLSKEAKQKLEKRFGEHYGLHQSYIRDSFFALTKNQIPHTPENLIELYLLNKFFKRNKILTFSFVRHPFERLVSAYMDRVLDKKMKGRMGGDDRGYDEWYKKHHSFKSFVELVLKEYKTYCLAKIQKSYPRYQAQLYENNCEFDINLHWRPYASACSYCHIHFDVIGQMETFSEDARYIIQKSNLGKKISIDDIDVVKHSTKQNTTTMTKTYFSRLTKNQIQDLYQMYRMDFEMFDFDIKSYL